MKAVLTIAGSDCSGGAGIQADIKTMSAHGVFAMSVITSVVAENTSRVNAVLDLPTSIIEKQIDSIFEDIKVDAVKVGMLGSIDIIKCVAEKLVEYKPTNVVVDPVMFAKNGSPLMAPNCIDSLINHILPCATVLTPNIPEAEYISGMAIDSLDDMKAACIKINDMGVKYTLIKGGHSSNKEVTDVLYDGSKFYTFTAERIYTKNTHGTGCTLSSAIASNLALGKNIYTAISDGKKYVTCAIEDALEIGKGNGPTNHFYNFYNSKGEQK